MNRIKFHTICPDCKKKRYLIRHHFITKELARYMIDVGKYERKDIICLRNQLTVRICKDCENKFHSKEMDVGKNGKRKKID